MVDTGAAASMAGVVIMEGIPEDIEVDTPVDSMAGILVVDTVLLLYLEHIMEGIILLQLEDILLGTMVVTTEDIEGGTMVVIEVDTMEGSMVEDFTHIGDLDGVFGDGLF